MLSLSFSISPAASPSSSQSQPPSRSIPRWAARAIAPPISSSLVPFPVLKNNNNKEKNKEQRLRSYSVAVADSSSNDFLRYTPYDSDSDSDSNAAPAHARDDLAGQLQVSIVTYRKTFPWRLLHPSLRVDLVSAVHIADKRYFEVLQERLAIYDCVLYEGVGDRHDSDEDTDKDGYNITGFLQRLIGRVLSMDFQLDCLNYKWRNWYNADLDWDTFQRLQEERGETIFATMKNALGSALKFDQHDSTGTQLGFDSFRSKLLRVSWIVPMPLAMSLLINLTCSPNGQDKDKEDTDDFGDLVREFLDLGISSGLKVLLARSLTSMFASEIYADLEEDSVIIGERNKAALEELKKAISRGEKRIAIFYGAGHMPDFGRRLRDDFDMVPTDVDWINAWSIRKNKSKFAGPFFHKYIGRFLPFSNETGRMLVVGSVSCSILLMDLWLWWSAFTVAYRTGFQMLRSVHSLVIM